MILTRADIAADRFSADSGTAGDLAERMPFRRQGGHTVIAGMSAVIYHRTLALHSSGRRYG